MSWSHMDINIRNNCFCMQSFVSQLEWRPYGHLICTPVCLLAGASFLKGFSLSNEYVKQIMNRSHALYLECFASHNQPLKIQELYDLIPSGQFEFKEAAGMLLTKVESSEINAEDLIVMSLSELLRYAMEKKRRNNEKDTCCVIVTTMDHTTCFLVDRYTQKLQVFDPLPASLKQISLYTLEKSLAEQYGAQNASALFSAILLELKME